MPEGMSMGAAVEMIGIPDAEARAYAKAIGRRVAAQRQERGWDQSELGRRAGVSPSYVSRLEGGVYVRPSVERLAALASALGCHIRELTDAELPDDAGALAERLYAAGVSRDRAPLVEKLVLDLARRTPRQQDQLIEMWVRMLELAGT
jgi:transcriptional regulator with XRE-family HTH domain